MPKFISDDDMAKLEASEPKKNFISDDDMRSLEAYHQKPDFIDKLGSIPGSMIQAGKTLLSAPSDLKKAIHNPGEAADVAARGLAGGASYLTIPEGLKLEGEKTIAKNLPEALGGLSDQQYQDVYGRGDDQNLMNQNMTRENQLRSKFPAVDLASRGAGFAAGGNPASMVAKTLTQSTSNALNQGEDLPGALVEGGQDALIQSFLNNAPREIATKAPKVLNSISEGLGSTADNLFENATGATGAQKAKFKPGTGRFLRDNDLIRFGDSPADIVERVSGAQAAAGKAIQSALEELDAKGVKASIPNVVDALQQKMSDLKSIPGNDAIVSRLQSEIDNLSSRSGMNAGPANPAQANIPVSEGEQAKRNYADSVNYFSPQSDQKAAFHAAGAFRGEVERAAESADPAIADKFKAAKDTYGFLAPVEEAAGKRANQLAQHPAGGLGDMVAAGVGGAPGVIAKKTIFPRISSSLGASADVLSKKLSSGGQSLGKYAEPLQAAAARGGNALGVTHYLLQSIDPEYQKLMQDQSDQQDQ